MERFRVPAEVVGAIRAYARSRGATLYTAALAAFTVVLFRAAGAGDVVIGGTTAGRGQPGLEDLVGLFVNPVALRVDLSGDPTFDDVLARVRATVLDALDHQDAPFEKVVERLRPPRDLSRHPLVQVAFEFQEHAAAPAHLGGLVGLTDVGGYTGAEYGGVVTARLDVELFVTGSPDGGLEASLVYASDLYGPVTMTRLGLDYRRVLDAMAADPGQRVSRVPHPS